MNPDYMNLAPFQVRYPKFKGLKVSSIMKYMIYLSIMFLDHHIMRAQPTSCHLV